MATRTRQVGEGTTRRSGRGRGRRLRISGSFAGEVVAAQRLECDPWAALASFPASWAGECSAFRAALACRRGLPDHCECHRPGKRAFLVAADGGSGTVDALL